MTVPGVVADESRCRHDTWPLENRMDEREVRPAELVGEKPID